MEILPEQKPRKLKLKEKGVKPCRPPASILYAWPKNFEPPQEIRRVHLDIGPLHRKNGTVAFVLENVLTPQECQRLIDMAEETSFNPALLDTGDHQQQQGLLAPGYRDCSRLVIDDGEFSEIIFSRLASFLPATLKEENLVGIHERLRFLRYDKGDKFEAHVDGPGNCHVDNCALITLEIYLNDGFRGGETTFLFQEGGGVGGEGGGLCRVAVTPKVGTVLVFQHELVHEGSLLREGCKYTVWADVVYTKTKIEIEQALVLDLEYFSFDDHPPPPHHHRFEETGVPEL